MATNLNSALIFSTGSITLPLPSADGNILLCGLVDLYCASLGEAPTDFVGNLKTRMIEQFKDKPTINAIIKSCLLEFEPWENARAAVLNDTLLSNSTDDALDKAGSIAGSFREGLSDDDFRAAIYSQIELNLSSGEPETVIKVASAIFSGAVLLYEEPGDAIIRMIVEGLIPSEGIKYGTQIVKSSTAGGITLELYFIVEGDISFTFADENGFANLDGLGFDELDYLDAGEHVGGIFTELSI